MTLENLARIRIVLVNTSHPGNIGAVARAMKNMCLQKLVLVDPLKYPHAEATARASGADDLLARADVVATLEQGLAGCGLVIGASARMRRLPWPLIDPRECATRAISEGAHTDVAIVFGREHSGLTNEELARCHYLVHIPSNPEYSSLNIAAAVQVITYEMMMAVSTGLRTENETTMELEKNPEDAQLASADEMEGFYQHLEQMLKDIDFISPNHQKQKMLRRLRRLYNRARINKVEMNILRGILTSVQLKASADKKPDKT